MKLSELTEKLIDTYKENGDMDVVIMREGHCYPEIEMNAVETFLYLEAYEEGEE